MCKIGNVCCLLALAHKPFSSNSLGLSAPEEAYSRNVRALGTLKFGYEVFLRLFPIKPLSYKTAIYITLKRKQSLN